MAPSATPNFKQYVKYPRGQRKQSSLPAQTSPIKAVYNAAGQRVATQINGVLTTLMVYDAAGKLVAEYGQSVPMTASIQYVFADHQGSARLVTDRTGAVHSRHDYQPFGEELPSSLGMRAQTAGYGTTDNVRQKYAGMETDEATNMAHTLWRKYDGQSGRWTSPDPYGGSMTIADPQSFNRYTYVDNDPLNKTDSLGLMADASQGWEDVENRFWGSYSNSSGPPTAAGQTIIENGMNGFTDREDEESGRGKRGQACDFAILLS